MQTFLPYPEFTKSAACLDYRRLGKQRIEARAVLSALFWPEYGWQRHPATKMWRNHELALAVYGLAMCTEWTNRGFQDNTGKWFRDFLESNSGERVPPPWLGDYRVHVSHQSNLLRKLPSHYNQFGWTCGPWLPYYWPV